MVAIRVAALVALSGTNQASEHTVAAYIVGVQVATVGLVHIPVGLLLGYLMGAVDESST